MQSIGENIWIFDGEAVPFFSLPYTTRMTVIRLSDGALWVHSPIKLTADIRESLNALGPIRYLIAPNALHHLFMGDWAEAYPEAELFGTHEVIEKRPDIHFHQTLLPDAVYGWSQEIDSLLFTGSKSMEECVFFHRASSTLLLTDLIENFAPEALPPFKRWIARCAGIVAPKGKTPIDWRLTFYPNKARVREHLATILSWQPKAIVMAHGVPVMSGAPGFLRRSFGWAGLTPE